MDKLIKKVTRKTFKIRYSGRSTDYISPSFGYGCLYNCQYCYMKRNKPEGLTIATNINDILTAINNHALFDTTEKPNQTDPHYITYDLSCNEDFCLHAKYYDWKSIFKFFKNHKIAKGSMATKYVNKDLLGFNPDKKIRIRFSLMPPNIHKILEPSTSTIKERLSAINEFIEAGYEVHLNYSPIIFYKGWLKDYKKLFINVNAHVKDQYKHEVLSECIFLTHNHKKHLYNLKHKLSGEHLLWNPKLQENKTSQYGGKNIRYEVKLKQSLIENFKDLHNKCIPWNTIRYIF